MGYGSLRSIMSPGQWIVVSVLTTICAGTALLSLSYAQVKPIPLIDLFFTATSTVCADCSDATEATSAGGLDSPQHQPSGHGHIQTPQPPQPQPPQPPQPPHPPQPQPLKRKPPHLQPPWNPQPPQPTWTPQPPWPQPPQPPPWPHPQPPPWPQPPQPPRANFKCWPSEVCPAFSLSNV